MFFIIAIIVFVVIGLIFNHMKMKAPNCIHCGTPVASPNAAICPACGRNRTVISSKKARVR